MAKVPHLRVVAAVIARNERYLITQRRPTAVLAGLWEFPGGRVEEGETDAEALLREVRERVGVEVTVGANIGRRTHDYDGYSVDLALYQAEIVGAAEPTRCGSPTAAGSPRANSRTTVFPPRIRRPWICCSA